ncbi:MULTISPECIES: hypothetical protein [unclassified Streptomyces]|uniref:hypothetical protein n=1 Tax=unclassified Streptomyces TaxID=2593676 RepID=UPI0036E244AF
MTGALDAPGVTGVSDVSGVTGGFGVVPGSVGAMTVLPVASTRVGGRGVGFADATGSDGPATTVIGVAVMKDPPQPGTG